MLVAASSAVSNVNNAKSKVGESLEKLTTGSRINSAADDAGGLNMSTHHSTQNKSLRVAINNINDGVSLLHTAEGGLDVMYDMLVRMRELAVQSGTETYNDTERNSMDTEWDELAAGFAQIADKTSFNTKNLLNSTETITLQVGVNNTSSDKININLGSINASTGANGLNISATFTTGIANRSDALDSLDDLDTAMSDISDRRAIIGGYLNRLDKTLNEASNYAENLTLTSSRISDTDFAVETSLMTRNQVMFNASTAALGQLSSMKASSISLIGT